MQIHQIEQDIAEIVLDAQPRIIQEFLKRTDNPELVRCSYEFYLPVYIEANLRLRRMTQIRYWSMEPAEPDQAKISQQFTLVEQIRQRLYSKVCHHCKTCQKRSATWPKQKQRLRAIQQQLPIC